VVSDMWLGFSFLQECSVPVFLVSNEYNSLNLFSSHLQKSFVAPLVTE